MTTNRSSSKTKETTAPKYINIDTMWQCIYDLEDAVKSLANVLEEVIKFTDYLDITPIGDYAKNRKPMSYWFDRLKGLEENQKELTKNLYEKIEELYSRRKPNKYTIK